MVLRRPDPLGWARGMSKLGVVLVMVADVCVAAVCFRLLRFSNVFWVSGYTFVNVLSESSLLVNTGALAKDILEV
mgnify:CR=1 FL=1